MGIKKKILAWLIDDNRLLENMIKESIKDAVRDYMDGVVAERLQYVLTYTTQSGRTQNVVKSYVNTLTSNSIKEIREKSEMDINAYLSKESFIDSVIERIRNKQL